MNKMHLLALGLVFLSCQKEPVFKPTPNPGPTPAPGLQVVWQYPLSPDTTDVYGGACFTWEGKVIYTTDFTVPEAQIHCRNAATGELLWKRDDLYHEGWTNRQIVSIADKTIACMSNRVVSIDNTTGEYVWKTDLRTLFEGDADGNSRIYSAGDFVYHAKYIGSSPYYHSITVIRARHDMGQWDALFTIPEDQDFHPFLSSVSVWVNPQGDSIAMVPVNMLGNLSVYGPTQRADLYAFNLRTRQVEWSLKDYDPTRSGSPIYPPVISDNHLYINCDKALYCIDLLGQKVGWSREFPGISGSYIRFNSLKEYQNTILLVSDENFSALAISQSDGSTVWENKSAGPSADELTLFEGVLYFTSRATGRLYAIDAATGATIWKMGSPNRTGKREASFGAQTLCIDPSTRLMYITDKYFIMCVKLPER